MDFIDTIADWTNVDPETMLALVRHKNCPDEYIAKIVSKAKQFSSPSKKSYKQILKTALVKNVVPEKDYRKILTDILTDLI